MKKNIAIVAGGYSEEAIVSFNSAKVVEMKIDNKLFSVYKVIIDKKQWSVIIDNKHYPIDKNDFSFMLKGNKIIFDGVFNIIHGTPGEDGLLQGYLEMLNIPQTSCNSTTSALLFNKHFCKKIVYNLNIVKIPLSVNITSNNKTEIEKITNKITMPCFVKPNKGGSSIGMTKVYKSEELSGAIERALKEDNEVLVEEFIKGRELTCGVFRHKGKKHILPLTEVVSKKDFFDYEAKYTDGMADEITPAPVSSEILKKVQNISSFLYDQLNCTGIVRFDYIFNDNGIYFLEVNTVPGMS